MSSTPRTRTRARPLDLGPVEPAPAQVSNEEGFIHVSRKAYGREEETMEKVRVPDFGGRPVARVRVGGSVTRNLGDYNSARVEVMIEMPCEAEMSEVKRVYDMLSTQLDELIPQELTKATTA